MREPPVSSQFHNLQQARPIPLKPNQLKTDRFRGTLESVCSAVLDVGFWLSWRARGACQKQRPGMQSVESQLRTPYRRLQLQSMDRLLGPKRLHQKSGRRVRQHGTAKDTPAFPIRICTIILRVTEP